MYVADYVVIMGYDEHYGGSPEAGSVASYDFVKAWYRTDGQRSSGRESDQWYPILYESVERDAEDRCGTGKSKRDG